jgi:hypothetical protein
MLDACKCKKIILWNVFDKGTHGRLLLYLTAVRIRHTNTKSVGSVRDSPDKIFRLRHGSTDLNASRQERGHDHCNLIRKDVSYYSSNNMGQFLDAKYYAHGA